MVFLKVRFIIFFIILFSFFSCLENDLAIPGNIISRDSMISVLADIHIAESRLIYHGYKPDNQAFKSEYLKTVLEKAGVDSAQFNSSFLFYSSHPDYFQNMYEVVITEISKRQAEHKMQTPPPPTAD